MKNEKLIWKKIIDTSLKKAGCDLIDRTQVVEASKKVDSEYVLKMENLYGSLSKSVFGE